MWWQEKYVYVPALVVMSCRSHYLTLSFAPFHVRSGLEEPDSGGIVLPDGIFEESRISRRLDDRPEIRT